MTAAMQTMNQPALFAPVVVAPVLVWGSHNGPYHLWEYDGVTYHALCDKRLHAKTLFQRSAKPPAKPCPACAAKA